MQQTTSLRCSRPTASIILFTIILLFTIIGCSSLFRSAGLSDEETTQQIAELKTALIEATTSAIADIKTGIKEGHDLKTLAIETTTTFAWKIATAAASTIGVILSTLLAKWLGTERKITKALIAGVEITEGNLIKTEIKKNAIAAGVEKQLHKRIIALT